MNKNIKKINGNYDIYPGKNNGYEVTCFSPNTKENYVAILPKAEVDLALYIQKNYPKDETLNKLIDEYGSECYSRGTDDCEMSYAGAEL